jgi:hypothetical protein
VNDHLDEYDWSHPCPYPLCVLEALLKNGSAPQFKDDEDLQFHLMDDHGFSRSRPRKLPLERSATTDPANTALDRIARACLCSIPLFLKHPQLSGMVVGWLTSTAR